jgi:sugar phosphate isomerase/epimerase
MKRREFIQTSSAAAVSLITLPSFMDVSKRKNSIGLQLYTLKDVIPQDPKGVLKKVAEFGYKEIETYSYKDGKIFGMAFTDFGKYCSDLGMKVVSGHYGMDLLRGDWERSVADAKAIGQQYICVPWLNDTDRAPETIKSVCAEINKAGEICNKYGIRLGYHNHDFEFKDVNGQPMYDIMLSELDPKYVGQEMDIYWVVYAGYDPLKYFEKYPGRFEQWHVKDMDKEDRKHNTEVGSGSIDFKAIFAKAKQSGMKHFYVEQEYFKGASLDSVKTGIDYLKKIV